MEWSDKGVVLNARAYGEAHAVVDLLTEHHGRHAGLVRGGASRKQRAVLQPGNSLIVTWRARLSEHLGTYAVELDAPRVAGALDDPLRLAALSAACQTAAECLPEREPHAGAYHALSVFLDHIEEDDVWPALLVKWELGLLRELGFGLDLARCVATGETDNLTYVSPKSGGAVCADAAEPYADKLLRLPRFVIDPQAEISRNDVTDGLALTGFFLENRIFGPADKPLPAARSRLAETLDSLGESG